MRLLQQAVLLAALTAGLAGCATEEYSPGYAGYPDAYAGNMFYCPPYPAYGFDCPGGFYYNDVFFPSQVAFFSYYHIDRRHWRDFHGRHYWDHRGGARPGITAGAERHRPRPGAASVGGVAGAAGPSNTFHPGFSQGPSEQPRVVRGGDLLHRPITGQAFRGGRHFGSGGGHRGGSHGTFRRHD